MYSSTKDLLNLSKIEAAVNMMIDRDTDDLIKRKNLMQGITPIVIEKFDPNMHRKEIMDILKTIVEKPIDAYVYLYDGNMLEEFYKHGSDFAKRTKIIKKMLDFDAFKFQWELFYRTLLNEFGKVPIKDIEIDNKEEYDKIYKDILGNYVIKKEGYSRRGIKGRETVERKGITREDIDALNKFISKTEDQIGNVEDKISEIEREIDDLDKKRKTKARDIIIFKKNEEKDKLNEKLIKLNEDLRILEDEKTKLEGLI